jgi:transcriptional regulator with XRE-family HTH domain
MNSTSLAMTLPDMMTFVGTQIDTLPLLAGQERRVPGLRREEVAVLAGVSTDYYARLERGNLGAAAFRRPGPSILVP